MPILAIDVGEKKIGLAIGDTTTRLAWPRPPLLVSSWDQAWPPLKKLVADEVIEQVVVGWPLNTDGRAGPQTERVEQFITHLAAHITVPILKRDERHSSQAVQREQQAVRRKLPRGQEDSLAAQLIAESYLAEKS